MSNAAAPSAKLRRLHGARPILALVAAITIAALSHLVAAPSAPLTGNAGPLSDGAAVETIGSTDSAAALPIGSLEQIDHSIRAWTSNVQGNDRDFMSATNLGLLYDARGRLSGDIGDYLRAKGALEVALAILPSHLPARLLHARLLQTTHDFGGALAEATAILRDDPTQVQALATAGDARLELGDVAGAASTFTRLATLAPGAPVTARLSRLAFIQGDPGGAVRLAQAAYDQSAAAGDTGPALGWYAYLAGVSDLSTGDPATGLTWFRRAVALWPKGYLALAGEARAEAALGRPDAAIDLFRRAVAIAPQPDALAALGDLYSLRGDAKLGADQYATVEAIGHLAAVNEQVYNRQLVLFSVNHDRDLAQALVLARNELQIRKDVYGYDAYAWALLANGRASEAADAMRQVRAFATKDAVLDYHEGMIALALGDDGRARALLPGALAVAGGLDPLSAMRARGALGTLR